MHKLVKHSTVVLAAVALTSLVLAAPASAQVELEKKQPSAGAMAYDLVLLRPLGIGAIALGGATFIVSLPFSILGGNVSQAGKVLVANPISFTLGRPLGVTRFTPD